VADTAALRPLTPVALEPCEKRSGRVSSTALVRYRCNDYSVPTRYGFQDVMVKGFVEEVVVLCGGKEVARHPRSFAAGAFVADPLHYLALIEIKPNALDQAAALRGLDLPEVWQSGDARPIASDKPRQKRGRRRPDPLVEVTGRLKRWFEDEPWRSGRELLEKLQAETPGDYPEGLLRTVQRRVKIWRSEQACALVFTHSSAAPKAAASSIWSIWSTSSNRKRPLGAAGTSSRNCCDTISSSSTNSAICRSASQARNCCST
jgi:hypothetical protein